MIIDNKNENLSYLNKALDVLIKNEKDWEYCYIEVFGDFFKRNLRFIVEQTQNGKNAHDLQLKLLNFSDKINKKFTNPAAYKLAFEIMGIAQGIFSKEEDKIDYTFLLPSEVRQKIYAELIAANKTQYRGIFGLEPVRFVSKEELKNADEVKFAWINRKNIFLEVLGCRTFQQAVDYIKKNKNLYSVNLSDFNDLTDQDLQKLQDCKWIQRLSISSKKITGNGFSSIKEILLNSVDFDDCNLLTDKAFEYLEAMPLQQVDVTNCTLLTDKALEYLKMMPLQVVNFSDCRQLTDKGVEYLKGAPLKNVCFNRCRLLTDKALDYIKGALLKNICFCGCTQITDKGLEYLKDSRLESVNFSGCPLLTDKALESLKGMPLKSLSFNHCPLLTDKALESLKGMPLRDIDFCGCYKLTDKGLEYLKELPLKSIRIYECHLITTEALRKFKQDFKFPWYLNIIRF